MFVSPFFYRMKPFIRFTLTLTDEHQDVRSVGLESIWVLNLLLTGDSVRKSVPHPSLRINRGIITFLSVERVDASNKLSLKPRSLSLFLI